MIDAAIGFLTYSLHHGRLVLHLKALYEI